MPERLEKAGGVSYLQTERPTIKQCEANIKQCREGYVKTLWYLHATHEVDGNNLGMFLSGSFFARVFVLMGNEEKKIFLIEVRSDQGDNENPWTVHETTFANTFSNRNGESPSTPSMLSFDSDGLPNDLLAPSLIDGHRAAKRLYTFFAAAVEIANNIPVDNQHTSQIIPPELKEGAFEKIEMTEDELVLMALQTATAKRNIKREVATHSKESEGPSIGPDSDDDGRGEAAEGRRGVSRTRESQTGRSSENLRRPSASPKADRLSQGEDKDGGLASKQPGVAASDSMFSWREGPSQLLEQPSPTRLERANLEADTEVHLDEEMAGRFGDEEVMEAELDVKVMIKVLDDLGHAVRFVCGEEMDERVKSAGRARGVFQV